MEESGQDAVKKKRGRIVLKANSRSGSQPSLVSDQPPLIDHTDGALEKMVHTRNQLKKEIFGQTFEGNGLHSYPPPFTPVHTSGLHSYPTHSTPVHTSGLHSYPPPSIPVHTTHHVLHTQSSRGGTRLETHYPGATSSASSDYDEPDFYVSNHLNHATTPFSRQSHDMQTSSTNSSPLHQPVKTQNAVINTFKGKLKRNQVHPQSQDNNSNLLEGFSPPPENGRTRFNIPDFTITDRSQHGNTATTQNNIEETDDFNSTLRVEKRLFSTSDSLGSTLSTTITPLLTSDLRKGGRKPSEKVCFEFDAESQLLSCFPDRQLQVFIVTWNMQERKLLPDSLDDLLLPLSQHTAADMFVIGTQESTPSRREWEVLLQQTLGPAYVLVQSASLGVIYLTLYLRRDLIWFCSAVQCSTFATRPGTLIKTKGGVAVSFTLFGTSFLFITSHFTAHDNKVQERNSDMQRIAASLTLCPDSSDKGVVLSKYDHVFWFGDLNYRVEATREQADHSVAAQDWMALLLKDQLTREILQGNVFQGFSEQPISFPPSYKFDSNSNTYDSSEKKRIPSWTDRILFKSLNGSGITGCGYSNCSELKISDHRPVHAVFKVELEPSKQLDGVPETIVSFDRSTYSQAQQRRRQLAEELSVPTEETDGASRQPSNHVTSSLCVLL